MAKEIIALDAGNKAGLIPKHAFHAAIDDSLDLARSGKVDEAAASLDKALEDARRCWRGDAEGVPSRPNLPARRPNVTAHASIRPRRSVPSRRRSTPRPRAISPRGSSK